MNVPKTIKDAGETEALVVARLAVAYTLLNDVPFDSWGHKGDPAEMAVLVLIDAKKRGHLSFVKDALGINYKYLRGQ